MNKHLSIINYDDRSSIKVIDPVVLKMFKYFDKGSESLGSFFYCSEDKAVSGVATLQKNVRLSEGCPLILAEKNEQAYFLRVLFKSELEIELASLLEPNLIETDDQHLISTENQEMFSEIEGRIEDQYVVFVQEVLSWLKVKVDQSVPIFFVGTEDDVMRLMPYFPFGKAVAYQDEETDCAMRLVSFEDWAENPRYQLISS